ncbi:MAG: D-alanine--D-alanine ligase [Planctomycetes bacterium]|nr:D-alanine--D-alanine ligase [Planctomycetota bacterium]
MSSFATDRARSSNRPLSIVVLLGGWSAEREVSLASGRAVVGALRSRGHDVREFDPAEMDFFAYPWAGADAAFIALHGPFGEDGTVQSLLDQMRTPYTGSGPQASRLAMSKSASKQRFRATGLATPNGHTVHVLEAKDSAVQKAEAIGYPLVVKPDGQGSSIGVSMLESPHGLDEALEMAYRHDPLVVLEKFIPGREVTVAVLERRPLPPIEIQSGRAFFDFQAKYHDDTTRYVFDLDLPAGVIGRIEGAAVAAVDALGCTGVTRVDMRLDPQHEPWVLEVNTVPGLTDHSLVPKAAQRAGISFAELCEQLVLAKLSPATEANITRAA